jgi:hypothetical protein
MLLVLFSCKKESPRICDVTNAQENLPWLKAIIDLSKTDTTGNYLGAIYAEKYLNKDIIFINMSMGSGGLSGYWYNCDGSSIIFPSGTIPPISKNRLIYSNLP